MNYQAHIGNLCLVLLGCLVFFSYPKKTLAVSDTELKKVEEQVKQQTIEHQKLQEQAATISKELAQVNKEMISTAKAIQNSEDKLSKMEKNLQALQKELDATENSFNKQDRHLIKNISAIQNLALKPTESLLVQPLSPVDIIRSAIILRESIPYLEDNARQIRQHFATVAAKKKKIERQIDEISKQKQLMKKEHLRMQKLAKDKASIKNKVEIKSAIAQKNMNKLASQAQDLRDLLQKIEKQRQKEAAKRKLEEKQSTDLIKSAQDSITNIASGFAKAKGTLPLPARGTVISGYGDQKNGVSSKGLTVATRPQAQVIAPFDGSVAFAGPFRSYGDMIIVEHDNGYLSLLAGLGSIDVEVGQMLLAGEPVGLMPNDQSAELYIEIRKNNQPINPAAWFKI